MRYEKVKDYNDEKFRRLTGVKRETFNKIIEIITKASTLKRKKGGRKPKLSIEDMTLATLEYWREYRTYFHIASEFGIHESNMYSSIRWVEDTLIKDGTFSLPGKKALLEADDYDEYEVTLIDASETPIERPKKNKEFTIRVKRSDTQ